MVHLLLFFLRILCQIKSNILAWLIIGRLFVFKHVNDDGLSIKVSKDDFLVNQFELDNFSVHLQQNFLEFLFIMSFRRQLFFNQNPYFIAIWLNGYHTAAFQGSLIVWIMNTFQSNNAHIWIPRRVCRFDVHLSEFTKLLESVIFSGYKNLVCLLCFLNNLHD